MTLDYEKLDVYQQSLQLIARTVPLLDKLPSKASKERRPARQDYAGKDGLTVVWVNPRYGNEKE